MPRSDDSGSHEGRYRRQLDSLIELLESRHPVFERHARCAAQAVGLERGRVLQLAASGELVSRALQLAEGEPAPEEEAETSIETERCFEGIVLERGRSLSISNAATHRQWRRHPAHTDGEVVSFVGVPVRLAEEAWGVLSACSRRPVTLTSGAARFLGRLADHLADCLERALRMTPLEESLPGVLVLLDGLGHYRGGNAPGSQPRGRDVTGWISRMAGREQRELETLLRRLGGGSMGPASESWVGPGGDEIVLYRRELGSIGCRLRPGSAGVQAAVAGPCEDAAGGPQGRSAVGTRPGNGSERGHTVWVVQDPSCARDATSEMLEHLGYTVRIATPARADEIGLGVEDIVLIDVADWPSPLERLAERCSSARQQLLIACDLEEPADGAGAASLRKPFGVQDLAQRLWELQAGR